MEAGEDEPLFQNVGQELLSKVFENSLILENILRQLSLNDLCPLRYVSKYWDELIKKQISNQILFCICKHWCVMGTTVGRDLKIFKSLKLCRVEVSTWPTAGSREVLNLIRLFQTFSSSGQFVKQLVLCDVSLTSEADIGILENILEGMPNLKMLWIQMSSVSIPAFLQFNPRKPISAKTTIVTGYHDTEKGYVKQFVNHILRFFPNLADNFNNQLMDQHLFDLMIRGDVCPPLRDIMLSLGSKLEPSFLKLVCQIPENRLRHVRHFSIWNIHALHEYADLVPIILQKFATTLEKLTLECSITNWSINDGKYTIKIPPLPNLRFMSLGLPSFDNGVPCFRYDLGKSLAKDFPFLQAFRLGHGTDKHYINEFQFTNTFVLPQHWEIWEPFVPLFSRGVDLTPFKFLKSVYLSLPNPWITEDEHIFWRKSFLPVYKQLYGNIEDDPLVTVMESHL